MVLTAAIVASSCAAPCSDASSSGTTGDCEWSLSDEGALEISGTGAMGDYSESSPAPWGTDVSSVTIGDSVTYVGSFAFYNCSSLKTVDVPDSVKSMGFGAFKGCTSLESATISASLTTVPANAFEDCSSLKSVVTPSSVTALGSASFRGCTSLESVDIPSVKTVGTNCFRGCTSLTSVTGTSSVTSISDGAFEDCTSMVSFDVPQLVTSISSDTFHGCTSLETVSLPSSVTRIRTGAFEGCTSLKTIDITNVTNIGGSAFEGCTSLATVEISSSATTVGTSSFRGCTSLASVTIPASVNNLGSGAFEGCTSLTAINVSVDNASYASVDGILYKKDLKTLMQLPAGLKLTSFTVPSTVTTLDWYSFGGCTTLETVEIPASVTKVGTDAFRGCTSLKAIEVSSENTKYASVDGVLYNLAVTELVKYPVGNGASYVTIPSTVTKIWSTAFYGFTSLKSIEIPASVTNIGSDAFYGCVFHDADGNELAANAANLAGHLSHGALCTDLTVTDEHSPAPAVRENVVDSTCSKEGSYDSVVYCSVCGEEISRTPMVIEKKPHTPVTDPAVEATCTRTGLTEGSHCSVCQTVLVPQEIIPMKPHTPAPAVKENIVEPTTSSEGSYDSVVYCSVCGEEMSREHVVTPKLQSSDSSTILIAVAAVVVIIGAAAAALFLRSRR